VGITTMKSLLICAAQQCYSDDQFEKNEVGAACILYGREEMCMQDYGGDT
jgi:hypothetical protein